MKDSLSSIYSNSIYIFLFSFIWMFNVPLHAQQGLSDPRDPIEVINRPFWTFTWDYADKYVAKPASEFYTTYMPVFLRTGFYNMALNLNEPASIINNLLQLKMEMLLKQQGALCSTQR